MNISHVRRSPNCTPSNLNNLVHMSHDSNYGVWGLLAFGTHPWKCHHTGWTAGVENLSIYDVFHSATATICYGQAPDHPQHCLSQKIHNLVRTLVHFQSLRSRPHQQTTGNMRHLRHTAPRHPNLRSFKMWDSLTWPPPWDRPEDFLGSQG